MPQVTVVIPTFNRADLIGQTLQSVAAQTFPDWECVVVDDGSTDNTRQVVESFAARDPRFRYAWQENASAAAARNRGVELATGEFIAFVDSDDLWPPDRLAWQVEALRNDPEAVLAYGNTFVFRNGDTTKGGLYMGYVTDKPAGWAFEKLIVCSSIYSPLVRASAIRKLGGFDLSLPSAEDWDTWLALSKVGKLVFDPRVALYYRAHEGNKSGNTLRNYTCATRVVRKHLAGLPLPTRLRLRRANRKYFRRVYTEKLLRAAHDASLSGDWPLARRHWRAVIKLNPALLARRSVFVNAAWALLPTNRAPVWRAPRPQAASGPPQVD